MRRVMLDAVRVTSRRYGMTQSTEPLTRPERGE